MTSCYLLMFPGVARFNNIIFQFNKQSVDTMVSLLALEAGARSPQELIDMIKIKMKDSSISPRTKSKVKEVVYFKKLKAIKQLVLMLDLGQGDVEGLENIPEDLRYEHDF